MLLRHALGLSRAHLFARLPDAVPPDAEHAICDLLARRARHVPTAYLTGHREFYDLDSSSPPASSSRARRRNISWRRRFALGRELLAEQRPRDTGGRWHRLRRDRAGRGEAPARDPCARHRLLSGGAGVADLNAKRLRLAGRVTFLHGDLLDPVQEPVDIVAANLPYIPTDVIPTLAPEVRDHEPRAALDGGPDGLRVIARLLAQTRAGAAARRRPSSWRSATTRQRACVSWWTTCSRGSAHLHP